MSDIDRNIPTTWRRARGDECIRDQNSVLPLKLEDITLQDTERHSYIGSLPQHNCKGDEHIRSIAFQDNVQISWKKKRVTAGEVDTWGKELGNCTHQWTTNDEKNKQALSTLSVFVRLKKKDRQQQKEERSREEDNFILLLSVFLR